MELTDHLKKSRIIMKKQANKTRRHTTFQAGDYVLLKLQPYRQFTASSRSSQKLSKRFFGPFQIIKRVGTVEYLLDMPSSSQIHPVVHVSLVKAYQKDELRNIIQLLPSSDLLPLSTVAVTLHDNIDQ